MSVLKKLCHKQIIPKLIFGIGSLLIFFSWAFQNYYTQAAEEKLSEINSSRQKIAFNEINKNLFSILINEQQMLDTFSLEKSVYATYSYCIYATTVHHIGLLMATDNNEEIDKNNIIYKENLIDLASWKKESRIDKLMNFASDLSKWENENGFNTVGLFQERFHKLRDEASKRANRHLAFYLIGSLLLGIAFIFQIKNEIEKIK